MNKETKIKKTPKKDININSIDACIFQVFDCLYQIFLFT